MHNFELMQDRETSDYLTKQFHSLGLGYLAFGSDELCETAAFAEFEEEVEVIGSFSTSMSSTMLSKLSCWRMLTSEMKAERSESV